MTQIEIKKKAAPKEGNGGSDPGNMGSSPSASKIFDPSKDNPIFKRDLYADLEKIEERGKRKKGLSIFGRKK